jgi:hypothetical protein
VAAHGRPDTDLLSSTGSVQLMLTSKAVLNSQIYRRMCLAAEQRAEVDSSECVSSRPTAICWKDTFTSDIRKQCRSVSPGCLFSSRSCGTGTLAQGTQRVLYLIPAFCSSIRR